MRKLFAVLAAGSLMMAGVANAASVATPVTLGVAIQGLAPITISGSGTVDVTGTTVTVPAGLVQLTSTIIIPVTASTAVNQLKVSKLSNLSGTFSLGGVTAQVPSELCGGGPGAGQACNTGGGIGGVMGLTGTIKVSVIPNIVVIPVNLNAAKIGQGGVGAGAFTTDAAAWSTGLGLVNTGNNVVGTSGSPAPLTLVTPTFISALGNLLPVFGLFSLSNVNIPEPGTLLLLGSGVLGLALVGRNRRK